MSLAQYSKEQLKEFSLIEVAYELLSSSRKEIAFTDLVNEMAAVLELSKDEIRARLAQFYTDLNIDGRFLALGDNRWGLRVWYPIETAEDEVASVTKPKKKSKKKSVDEDDVEVDEFAELEEEDYDDLDDFIDEDEDLLDDDEEEFDDIDEIDEFEDEDEEDVDVVVEVDLEDEEEFDIDEDEDLGDDEEVEDEELDLDEDEDL